MSNSPYQPNPEAHKIANAIARGFFKTETDPESVRRAVRAWLFAIPSVVVFIPLAFYLRFGTVGPLGWGLTIFFVVYCLLSAIGLHFLVRPEYHTPVEIKNDWIDRVGAFWLVSCAFGPFFGWILVSAFSLTTTNWWWLYLGRVLLCIGVPLLTSFALVRYVRGHGAPLMLGLLIGVTALPVWSAWGTLWDLRSGPLRGEQNVWVLPRTQRVLQDP